MLKLLKQVVAQRFASGKSTWTDLSSEPQIVPQSTNNDEEDINGSNNNNKIVLDEATDVIEFPGFHGPSYTHDVDFVPLSPDAVRQLKEFVFAVGNAYHSNPFHCLQHASQVTMAATKLLSRIIVKQLDNVEEEEYTDDEEEEEDGSVLTVTDTIASHIHNHTYGLTSDPLTQFTLVLSAFVHAVDHKGVPNSRLIVEEPEAAARYRNRSITEQRSVDKIWKKLMDPCFVNLRQCIYCDVEEKKRFRQVLVNSVLATDFDDDELQVLRMKRWEGTFQRHGLIDVDEDVHRKATIVIEYLMQAANIFHCMQPWIIYEKWSSRLFEELWIAYKAGRSGEDPSQSWYQKELDFFDHYAIPLAMQLKDCDVFVVGGDEFLNYAIKNRQRWTEQGKEWVTNMVDKVTASGGGSRRRSFNGTDMNSMIGSEASTCEGTSATSNPGSLPPHVQRLVDWNVDMLTRQLKFVVAKRVAQGKPRPEVAPIWHQQDGKTPIDEVVDCISLEDFDPATSPDKLNSQTVQLSQLVEVQLRRFVTGISAQFRDNPFHGLDHGSHVCMTTRKFISRIITMTPGQQQQQGNNDDNDTTTTAARELHQRTFGISSDPLAQFAIIFAAIIHDIDHNGVTNGQLRREESSLARKYKNRCILETKFDRCCL